MKYGNVFDEIPFDLCKVKKNREKWGGGRMCNFLKPLKLTQELSQKMSYSSELWYGRCFYDVYSGTAKKLRRNHRYRRKPPSAAKFFFTISR